MLSHWCIIEFNSHLFWMNDLSPHCYMGQRTVPLFTVLKPIFLLVCVWFLKLSAPILGTHSFIIVPRLWWTDLRSLYSKLCLVLSVSFLRYKYNPAHSHLPLLFTLQCRLSIFLSVQGGLYSVKWICCIFEPLHILELVKYNHLHLVTMESYRLMLVVVLNFLLMFSFLPFIVWWLTVLTLLFLCHMSALIGFMLC